MTTLPIDHLKDEILAVLKSYRHLILKASPGSGKTTRVPLFLKEITHKKIYVLEPRKIAAKLAAQQLARTLGESVGQKVGYIFRYERAISEETQIIFVTEGTFLKIIGDPKSLNEIDFIVLDEFHERHLSTDSNLSFITTHLKQNSYNIQLLIMSATMETNELLDFLNKTGSTKTIELESSRFHLHLNYLPNVTSIIQSPLEKKVRDSIEYIWEKKIAGDILVFLPGMKEIQEAFNLLQILSSHLDFECFILHGDLSSADQMRALSPSLKRKVILSTNIAESSVTIPGISIVIDSGFARESFHNPYTGLREIKLTKISKSSAIQRAGRANRQSEGHCFRLFAELDFAQREDFQKAEILRSDLSELTLLALEKFKLPLDQLEWFEAPPKEAMKASFHLLRSLNAIDESSNLTKIGEKMQAFSLHPRLSRILVEALKSDQTFFKLLLNEIDKIFNEKLADRFLSTKFLSELNFENKNQFSLEEILLYGFPDRIAKSRGAKHGDLVTSTGETLKISPKERHRFNPDHELWIVLDIDNSKAAAQFFPIEEEWLYNLTPLPLSEESELCFDQKKLAIIRKEKIIIGSIVLSESSSTPSHLNGQALDLLKEYLKQFLLDLTNSNEYQRLGVLNTLTLNLNLDQIQDSFLKKLTLSETRLGEDDLTMIKENFFHFLKISCDPNDLFDLNRELPLLLQLSDKRKVTINYEVSQSPWIETYIQDLYGLKETPMIAKGKLKLTLKLLGPHKRALQVTQDLMSFWKNTYPKMLKELTRDYPRHYWPIDPENAKPFLLKRHLPSPE